MGQMSNVLPAMLLNDIEDQIKELFTGNEIISLTNLFASSVGEKVTFQSVNFNSKKDILSRNISDLSDDAKIQFFKQLKTTRKVAANSELVNQINELLTSNSSSVNIVRNSVTDLLNKYSSKVAKIWIDSIRFYDNGDYRNSLDSIRLSLELLLKDVLNNDKSLENQKRPLGDFLKDHGISSQFRNLFFRELDMYEKIQNNKVKHNVPENLSKSEIIFLMNQAVLIIKFIDRCNNVK